MAKTIKKTTSAKRRAAVARKAAKPSVAEHAREPQSVPANVQGGATKKEVILSLLRRDEGATLAELMGATGWQAHSVRGFISGALRKRLGLTVATEQRSDGHRAYHVCA